MKPKTGKQIVSKREYAILISRRIALVCGGICVALLALAFTFFASMLFREAATDYRLPDSLFGGVLLLGIAACVMVVLTAKFLQRASKPVDVVPITRANTADLPAPESLVRASAEPEQIQQAVLLRAAQAGQATQAEQLVRASLAYEEQA